MTISLCTTRIIGMAGIAFLLASCGGPLPATEPASTSPAESSTETEAPTTEMPPDPTPVESGSLSTHAGNVTNEPPAPPTEEDTFDEQALLDDLWAQGEGDSQVQIGFCTLWKNGEMVNSITEGSSLPWEEEEIDAYFEEKCAAMPDGSRTKPFPPGTSLAAGDWSLDVRNVELNSWSTVQAQNQFNDPPVDGHQFVMLEVYVQYEGHLEPVDPSWTFDFAIVGDNGNTFTERCGVIPQPLRDVGDMYAGAEATGNACISAAADQLEGATIRIGTGNVGQAVFVDLAPVP